MSDLVQQIAANYERVRERIAWAAQRADRQPEAVTVVAVTKTWPAEVVVAAYEAGLRHFGENRAEELAEKRPEVEAVLGQESSIAWHLIGPLQSRKTALAADHADIFHALDRLKIARRLSRHLEETGGSLPVLLEVNVSGEESKAGFDVTQWEENEGQRERLREVALQVVALPHLQIEGLMTMAPWQADGEVIQSVFRRTHALATWLQEAVPQTHWSMLSMGMTDDFELAVEQGATHVRLGRALFGPRREA
jgi:pyridoxal phosphate enzyme (YggS family)